MSTALWPFGLLVATSLVFDLTAGVGLHVTLPGRSGFLIGLALRELLVVLGVAIVIGRLSRLRLRDFTGPVPEARVWLALPCIALGYLAVEPAVLGPWSALLGVTPPSWYETAVVAPDWQTGLLVGLVLSVTPAVAEEAFFRGTWLTLLDARFSRATSSAVQAVGFAAFHLDLFGLPSYLAAGALFAALRRRTASLWPCIALHALINALSVLELNRRARGQALFEPPTMTTVAMGVVALAGGLWLALRPSRS